MSKLLPHRRARRLLAVLVALGLAATGLTVLNLPVSAAEEVTVDLYDDGIVAPFGDYSWGEVDYVSSTEVADGSVAMAATLGPWEGLYLGTGEAVSIPLDGELRFAVHGGSNPDARLQVQLVGVGGGQGPAVVVDAPGGTWTDVAIPLADLGGFGQIQGLWWQESQGAALSTIYVDSVSIVGITTPTGGGDGSGSGSNPAATGPGLAVSFDQHTVVRSVTDPYTDVTTDQAIAFPHPISVDVYGMNFAPDALREELDVPVNRWGGNAVERYNHKLGTTSLGNDWYFAISADEGDTDHAFESGNQADGTDSIITIPLMGYVAGPAGTCSFPTDDRFGAPNNAGQQDSTITHWLDSSVMCGNGYRNGEFLGAVDPSITSIAVDESWAREWVAALVAQHGTAADGGVEYYAMGNEPGLWHSTHGDIRPAPIPRAEIIARNLSYGMAVKSVDPTASVIGPVSWSGHSYYVTRDELLDGRYPGVLPTFLADYLGAMAAAEAQTGDRVLDTLAVNFYDDRVYGGGSDELRLEATRQLWDPGYAPADWWVTRDFLKGDGSAVIPRLQSLIDANYPGTDLAITEYNFGAPETVAGGLAQADALGIMGREGLDMATVWEPYADWLNMSVEQFSNRPIIHAFRLYRNYDGQGGRFGDVSLHATSSDEGAVSIYAAERSADGALTLMVINKSTTAQASALDLGGRTGTAEAYRFSGADLNGVQPVGDVAIGADTVLQLPARSATLLVLSADGGSPVEPPAPPTTTTTAPSTTTEAPTTTAPETTTTSVDAGGPVEPTVTVPVPVPTISTTSPETIDVAPPTVAPTTTEAPPDTSAPPTTAPPAVDPTPDPAPPAVPPVVDTGAEQPSVGDGARLIGAPSTVAEGGLFDSNDTTWVWSEGGPVTLDRGLYVNRVEEGTFNGHSDADAYIPAGTTVCSYQVLADRLDDRGRLTGSLTFTESEVIGIFYRKTDLRRSAFLGSPEQTKPAPLERSDRVTLSSDGSSITLSWDVFLLRGLDGMRVLTTC
ncbi:MAG: glycoside hydrolase family 44 protein [Actinomycetota bacterium]